ncbi:MAG: Spore protein [Pseudomonadota bacterium]|jgi:HSP20 family protein
MTGHIVPWRWKKKTVPVGGQHDVVSNLQRQVNRLFNEVVSGSSFLPDFVSEPLAQLGERLTTFAPSVNVRKTETAIIVAVELPGMDERDVEISLTTDGLAIRGERKADGGPLDGGVASQGGIASEGGEWNYSESAYGPFERIVPLAGLRVQADRVDATASKGIVTITLPLEGEKGEEPPVKKVQIRPSL